MRVLVFGSGGVGGYFGGRLAAGGHEVVFVARGAHLRALRCEGLRLSSPQGNLRLPVRATDDAASAGAVDVILVCVKSWQLAEAAEAIAPLVTPATLVVPLLNGVEAPGLLRRVLGGAHVAGGLCRIISYVDGPGHVRHAAGTPSIAFGDLGGGSSAAVELLRRAFADAGVAVDTPADVTAAMWEKFLLIASWGGVGAVTRAPVGTLRAVPETRRLLRAAMDEVAGLAAASGVGLTADAAEGAMRFLDDLAPTASASLQRDVAAGRRSELDSHSGAVVRLAGGAGRPAPVHGFLYAALLPGELAARGRAPG